MAGRDRGAPAPEVIDSLEIFTDLLENQSQTKLIVIDCHQEWCGPTSAMNAFWDQQFKTLENCGVRLSLHRLCVNAPSVHEDILKQIAKAGALDGIRMASQGCKPFFVFLRFGAGVAAVDGVNATALNMMLDLHLPKVVKKKKDDE